LADLSSRDKRKDSRWPVEEIFTEIQLNDATVPVRILDLSEGGLRLALPKGQKFRQDDEVTISLGKVFSRIKGRVRWADPTGATPDEIVMGIQFGNFVVEPRKQDEIQSLLDAWRDISETYSVYDSFLHIVDILDMDVLDGKIDNLSDAVHSLVAWLDQKMGPINVWSLIREGNSGVSARLLVDRHPLPKESLESRLATVRSVAVHGVTTWVGGRPYLLAGDIVLESVGPSDDKIDLLQKMAALMSLRITFWTKLLVKNVALDLFGEQIDILRRGKA
jgi:hypothetical protein